MPLAYRFTEACALLPMLYLPAEQRDTVVCCVGPQADLLAVECLRWRDVRRVHLCERPLLAPPLPKDGRVVAEVPKPASCHLVLMSPSYPWEKHTALLAEGGVLCVSSSLPKDFPALLQALRKDGWSTVPWREHLPEPLFGALCGRPEKPTKKRRTPPAAKRLNEKMLPSLFTFANDETALVFGENPGKTPEKADHHGELPRASGGGSWDHPTRHIAVVPPFPAGL